jgi:hypothetical protein
MVRIGAENEGTRHGTASHVKAAPDIVAGIGANRRGALRGRHLFPFSHKDMVAAVHQRRPGASA